MGCIRMLGGAGLGLRRCTWWACVGRRVGWTFHAAFGSFCLAFVGCQV